MKKKTIVEIIALLFVVLFLYTGISKLMDYDITKEQIALSPLLAPIASWTVIALPVTEIIVSVILFIPRTRIKGLYASLALMVAFTGYVVYILSYNDQLPCTCGGVLQSLSWKQHLLFNAAFIVLALTGIVLGRQTPTGINYSLKVNPAK